MSSKTFLKVTTTDGAVENEKMSVTGKIDSNDMELLKNLYQLLDNLSNGKLVATGQTQDDFAERVLDIVSNNGKFQVNITVQ